MKKIILVDGNNLLFRSYYATAYTGNVMRNSKGFPTNGLYGFINMMNKIIREENPNYILVAFDKGKTFRHDKYEVYKAGRATMPEELREQFPVAKDILGAMGIKYFEIDNYEADDIIGTMAKKVDEEDEFVATIISSDKDLLQLISDEVTVKLLKSNDYIMMNKEEFRKTYKCDPINMIDLKALMGDASDNIPGVKGIGEKTAISLMEKFGSLQNIYDNLDKVTGKTREKLQIDKENAFMSYDIATIYREVPIPFTLEDCQYDGINRKELLKYLEELEMPSLIRKYDLYEESLEEKTKKIEVKPLEIGDISKFDANKDYAFYIETRGSIYSKSELLGIGIYDGCKGYFISPEEIDKYKDIFSSDKEKYTYDQKKNIVVLNNYNISFKNVSFDSLIALYLLDYVVKDDISFVAKNFDYDIELYEDVFGSDKRPKEVESDKLIELITSKAKFIYETKEKIEKDIKENNLDYLFREIEMPLSIVLADMELTGIRVDVEYLTQVQEELKKKMEVVEKEIYEIAGCKFNILSPVQLAKVLFDDLNIPYPSRVKSGKYSTSKDILDKLEGYPIVSKVLEYRTLSKLHANYAVGLIDEVREDGRIHTIYTQALTRTGRLSSICPNLQNIPARGEYSEIIRKAFVPDCDSVLLGSDYSQVELRVFAHMSNTQNLIDAFKNDKDIHTKTASDIFHIPMEDVTKDQRRTAKAVNFGIVYGISSFGLANDLGIDFKDAKQFLDNYLETYPGIVDFMDKLKNEAYKFGYSKTLMGRKRIIEELKSKNYMIRQGGERMALNTPIQGTAADILKKAMVEIYQEFNRRNLGSKMLLQVHDELVFNVLKSELDEVLVIVREIMENTYKLNVPLKVDIAYGDNWAEAK